MDPHLAEGIHEAEEQPPAGGDVLRAIEEFHADEGDHPPSAKGVTLARPHQHGLHGGDAARLSRGGLDVPARLPREQGGLGGPALGEGRIHAEHEAIEGELALPRLKGPEDQGTVRRFAVLCHRGSPQGPAPFERGGRRRLGLQDGPQSREQEHLGMGPHACLRDTRAGRLRRAARPAILNNLPST